MKDIIKVIEKAKSVAVIPHVSADGDAIGSCKAMAEVLTGMGKDCVIYNEEPVEKRLGFLADGIVVYNGEQKQHDICIVLDCGDLERVGSRRPLLDAAESVINIDHHKTNTYFGDVNLVQATACATGEILVSLFEEMGISLTKKAAEYLYTAICSDSGCFKYSNVSAETLRRAARLLDVGFDHSRITHLLFETVPLNVKLMMAEATQNIRLYFDGRLKIVSADEALIKKYELRNDEIEGLVDIPRQIEGTDIAAAIKCVDGKIRASLRSNNDTDVAEIALTFGGGGHAKAAGCTIDAESLEEAEKLIVEACGRVLK